MANDKKFRVKNGIVVTSGDIDLNGGSLINGTVSGNQTFADGTAAAPSITFTNDTDTGIYSSAADKLAISTGGIARAVINSVGYTFQNGTDHRIRTETGVTDAQISITSSGTYSAASGAFASFAGTTQGSNPGGISLVSGSNANSIVQIRGSNNSSEINFEIGTTLKASVDNSGLIISNGKLLNTSGSNTAPAYTFTGDEDTGIYSPAADQLAISTAGVERLRIGNSISARNNATFFLSDGSAALPSLSVLNDNNTGIFSLGADQLAISTGGVQRIVFDNSGLSMSGTIRASSGTSIDPSITFNSDQDTGFALISPGNLSMISGAVEKARIDSSGIRLISGIIRNTDGTAAIPSVTFTSDSDTGIYRAGTDQLAISTGGVERVKVFASGNTSFSGSILAADGTAAIPSIQFLNDGDTGIYSFGANTIGISAGGNNRATFDTTALTMQSGNVIRTSSGIAGGPGFSFAGDTNTGIYSPAADQLAISTAGSERMRIDSVGNVGINKTDPAYELDVGGNARLITTSGNSGIRITTANTAEGYLIFGDPEDASMAGISYSNATNTLSFDSNNAERMTIDSAGNVGIGTTNPINKFVVSDGGATGYEIAPQDSNNLVRAFVYDRAESAYKAFQIDATDWIFNVRPSNTEVARFDSSGLKISSGDLDMNGGSILNAGLAFSGGTAAVPGFSFSGDSNTGIFSDVADNLGFSTGGVERLTIDNLGRVGVFNTAPVDDLVVGNGSNSTTDFGIMGSSFCDLNFRDATDVEGRISYDHSVNTMSIYSEKLVLAMGLDGPNNRINTYSNVRQYGDLTMQSGAQLFLDDGLVNAPSISFSSNTLFGFYKNGSNLRFVDGGVDRLQIGGNGYFSSRLTVGQTASDFRGTVVIGTGSGLSTIDFNNKLVLDASGNCGMTICSGTSNQGVIAFADSGDADIGKISYFHSTNTMYLTVNAATRMEINSSGNIKFNSYGAGTLSTDASGNISASDGRLKNKLNREVLGSETIMSLQPTWYDWKENSGFSTEYSELGFIAQEVGEVLPEAAPGTDETVHMRNYHDRAILASLVKHNQELEQDKEKLESKVLELEGTLLEVLNRLNKLENK